MTKASSLVHKQDAVDSRLEPLDESLFRWVEIGVHPARAALRVGGHVVVEGTERFGIRNEPVEEMQGCFVAVLPGPVDGIFGVPVARLGKVLGKVGKCRALHVEAGRVGG